MNNFFSVLRKFEYILITMISILMIIGFIGLPFCSTPSLLESKTIIKDFILNYLIIYLFLSIFWGIIIYEKICMLEKKESIFLKFSTFLFDEGVKKRAKIQQLIVINFAFFFLSFIFLLLFFAVIYNLIWLKFFH